MAVCSLTATAQERSDTLPAPRMRFVEPRMPLLTAEDDSLHLPLLNQYGQVRPIGMYPYLWSGFDSWDLHRGLNVSMGASVFSSFGKHARGGTGFAQNVARSPTSCRYPSEATTAISTTVANRSTMPG